MPPEQAGRLHPDAQLIDMIGLGEVGQRGREGIGAGLGVGHTPARHWFGAVGEQEADTGVILTDIQADIGDGGHMTPPRRWRSGKSGRGRRHNILARNQNSRTWVVVSSQLLPWPDPTFGEQPGGQKSTSYPEQTVLRERSASHGTEAFVPTGHTA